VKKGIAFWVLVGMIAAGAFAFYIVVVRGEQKQHAHKRQELLSRKTALENLKQKGDSQNGLPNEEWIQAARAQSVRMLKQVEKSYELLLNQRRRCHSRIFYVNPKEPAHMRREIDITREKVRWRRRYQVRCLRLRRQLESDERLTGSAGVFSFRDWGVGLPTDFEIKDAQAEFWLQKDVCDVLTNRAITDIELTLAERQDERLKSLFDVVRSPRLADAETYLRGQQKDELVGILHDLLINMRGENLPRLFARYGMWKQIEPFTMDEAQKELVEYLVHPDQDRADLVDFINDLRNVRYRADMADLARNHNQKELARLLARTDAKADVRILEVISAWDEARLAAFITTVTCITAEEDYEAILGNHQVNVASVDEFRLSGATGMGVMGAIDPGLEEHDALMDEEPMEGEPGMPADYGAPTRAYIIPGMPDVCEIIPFRLSVRMHFEDLPAFMRRLLSLDWRIRVKKLGIVKAGPVARREGGPGEEPWGPGEFPEEDWDIEAERPDEEFDPRFGAPPGARPLTEEEQLQQMLEQIVAPKELVAVSMECDALRFLPLWRKLHPPAEPATAAE